MFKLYENGQIMKVLEEGHEVGYGNYKEISINNINAIINNKTMIPITYKIFDLEVGNYVVDDSINKDIEIYVNGILMGSESILEGKGVIEFESEKVGKYIISLDGYSCEVTVNEN